MFTNKFIYKFSANIIVSAVNMELGFNEHGRRQKVKENSSTLMKNDQKM